MGASLAQRIVPAQPQSRGTTLDTLKPKAAKAGINSDAVPVDATEDADADKRAYLGLVDEARIRAGLSVKEMALSANVDIATFSAALKGTSRQNFAAHWLHNQPALFKLAYQQITAERYGLSEATKADVFAERIGELVTLLLKDKARRTA